MKAINIILAVAVTGIITIVAFKEGLKAGTTPYEKTVCKSVGSSKAPKKKEANELKVKNQFEKAVEADSKDDANLLDDVAEAMNMDNVYDAVKDKKDGEK